MKINVLVAGVGGVSLGTEIIKCLKLKNEFYNIFVCDISSLAYGLYEEGIAGSFLSNGNNYWESIKKICVEAKIRVIIPGGEQPMRLLNPHIQELKQMGIAIALNSQKVVDLCSNKARLFDYLEENQILAPKTYYELNDDLFNKISFPCIVKPSEDSGGSAFVSIANSIEDVKTFAEQIIKSGRTPIFQDYLPLTDGEYSFSVLSYQNGEIFGGIGIKKNFDIKLMYTYKSDIAIISSGYSQGWISSFPYIFSQVCKIAKLINSCGPLNIEGRVIDGLFYPFEINPRFSATTYLWAIAGFNDVDYFVRMLCDLPLDKEIIISSGYGLRSFTEKFISSEEEKNIKYQQKVLK